MCGDGVRDLSEVCDDGGTVGSDGCSADCESDESCGNGQLDPGELCDDGVEVYGDFCDATCNTSTLCPTGGLSNEEYCEDGLECTVGVCDEQLGCSQVPAAEETSCGGGAGSCRSGGCVVPELVMSGVVTCYLDEAGQVSCWGVSGNTNNNRILDNVPGGVWTDIALKDKNVCVLSPAGQAHCWGYTGTNEPLVAFRSIEVTATAVCGIRESDSQVQCWGSTTSEVTWPDTNTYVEPVAELVSADRSFCALQQDGALQCWGAYGDLGLPCCNSGASKTLAGPYVKLRGSTNYYCAQAGHRRVGVLWRQQLW